MHLVAMILSIWLLLVDNCLTFYVEEIEIGKPDLHGSEILQTVAINELTCARLCERKATCAGFAINVDTHTCVLGNNMTEATFRTDVAGWQQWRTFKTRCSTGMPRFRNSCYFVSSTQRNWNEARTSCERHGGHLAVVNDGEEYKFLVRMIKTSDWFSFPVYWLGGYRPANSLACKWLNSDDWVFVNVQQSIPVSNEEVCLLIQKDVTDENRRWAFVSCNNALNYICEI